MSKRKSRKTKVKPKRKRKVSRRRKKAANPEYMVRIEPERGPALERRVEAPSASQAWSHAEAMAGPRGDVTRLRHMPPVRPLTRPIEANPFFSPPAMQYVAWAGNPLDSDEVALVEQWRDDVEALARSGWYTKPEQHRWSGARSAYEKVLDAFGPMRNPHPLPWGMNRTVSLTPEDVRRGYRPETLGERDARMTAEFGWDWTSQLHDPRVKIEADRVQYMAILPEDVFPRSNPSEGEVLHQLFSRPVPPGLVRWWVDDGQGGGWIEYITPEEAARRERGGYQSNPALPIAAAAGVAAELTKRALKQNPCYGLHWHQDRPFSTPPGLFEATHGMRGNPPSERRLKQRVLRYMQSVRDQHVDPRTGEGQATQLAEDAADYFQSWRWLDDPDHWVWDLAVQAIDPDPRFRFNPYAYCGHAPRRVTAAMRHRWPDEDFGLIEWERAKRGGQRRSGHRGRWHKRRKYPMRYSALAANAKARAEAAYEEGYLTRTQLRKIVRKANRVLAACGGIY